MCRTLQGANIGLFLVRHRLAYKNKELFKTVYDQKLFRINIYEGNENKAKFCRISKLEIGCPYESLYLEKKTHYPKFDLVLNVLLCIFDANKGCKKKSLKKFSLAADLLNSLLIRY